MVSVEAIGMVAGMERSEAEVAALAAVSKRYGAVAALDGLSLTLKRGEVLALLGPNGAGKSTAIRCLLGLIAPTSGTVRVFGQDPRQPAARTRIGAMLQVASMPADMTENNIRLVASDVMPALQAQTPSRAARMAAE